MKYRRMIVLSELWQIYDLREMIKHEIKVIESKGWTDMTHELNTHPFDMNNSNALRTLIKGGRRNKSYGNEEEPVPQIKITSVHVQNVKDGGLALRVVHVRRNGSPES